jgi:hypothetical protein
MIEQYNRRTCQFEPNPNLRVLDFGSISGAQTISDDETVYIDMCLYEIPETCIRALRAASRRFPRCLIRFTGSFACIEQVAAETEVGLIIEGTIPPIGLSDTQWPLDFIKKSLEMGASGALVDFNPGELAQEFPSAVFLRRSVA